MFFCFFSKFYQSIYGNKKKMSKTDIFWTTFKKRGIFNKNNFKNIAILKKYELIMKP